MTETNRKQDITTNSSEENNSNQTWLKDNHVGRVIAGKTPNYYGEWQLIKV